MHSHSIRELQLIKICHIVLYIFILVKHYGHLVKFNIYRIYKANISIEYTLTLCKVREPFPGKLIIVSYLHHLVAYAKHLVSVFLFNKSRAQRIENCL